MYKDESGESKGDALVTFSTPLHAANAAVKVYIYKILIYLFSLIHIKLFQDGE